MTDLIITPQSKIEITVSPKGVKGDKGEAGGFNVPANNIVTSPFQLAVNQVYKVDRPTIQLLNLPVSGNNGDAIIIYGLTIFRVTQNIDQVIYFNDSFTTQGITGKIESLNQNSTLKLVCLNDDRWFVADASGNFEVL